MRRVDTILSSELGRRTAGDECLVSGGKRTGGSQAGAVEAAPLLSMMLPVIENS